MECNYCLFYVAGLLAALAYDEISFNKIATQSQNSSSGTGYDASNAVDGNTATCMRTDPIGGIASYYTVWWKLDLGGVYKIYSIRILFKNYPGYDNRQRGRFAGFSLYVSYTDVSTPADIKSSTLCYKDGPHLPPLNFSAICTIFGRYIIFYNERLNGVKYPNTYEVANVITELCEVTVQGCNNASIYGSNCDTPCPTNCKDSTCHIQSGACFTCKPGWTGINCNTKCKEGWYGVNCSQQCSGHCRDGAICNHVTGLCDGGCEVGWTGYLCDKACDDGTYGYHCVNNCSGHCLNGYPCNKQTGHCDGGCNPGYTNGDCNKECSAGQFGFDCSNRCSGHCINNVPCDHVSGVCLSGCQDGFLGIRCAKTCMKGYFGTNCSQMCSSNCKPDTCRHTDGWCICAAGWTGDNCTTACVQSYGENCRYPCSLQCYNNTCDRFNGRCLLGCDYGFYGDLCNREMGFKIQNTSCSIMPTIGLSVSLLINLIFIVCGILLCRRNKKIKMEASGNLLSCCKRSIYQDIVVKTEETSTYQELDLSDSAYQNTTPR